MTFYQQTQSRPAPGTQPEVRSATLNRSYPLPQTAICSNVGGDAHPRYLSAEYSTEAPGSKIAIAADGGYTLRPRLYTGACDLCRVSRRLKMATLLASPATPPVGFQLAPRPDLGDSNSPGGNGATAAPTKGCRQTSPAAGEPLTVPQYEGQIDVPGHHTRHAGCLGAGNDGHGRPIFDRGEVGPTLDDIVT